jgi:uncharacterized phage-associated protein
MHDARAIANFFIERSVDKSRPVTVMTLLKVLYFAHGWHLAKTGQPLVAQPFEAWKHGPVNRVVYEQMKGQGSKPVTSKLTSFDVEHGDFVETSYNLNPEMKTFLGDIFDSYSQYHPFTLSDLTHVSGSPWDIVWSQAEHKAVPGMVISNALIKKWFQEGGLGNPSQKIKGYNT